ncbi:type IV secretion system protein [Succinivibrio sp.]|uniref:type IV secretion system protein n=1 Tax=Succinivibrio sp. TaxID=2053619 RepID=UPI00386E5D00
MSLKKKITNSIGIRRFDFFTYELKKMFLPYALAFTSLMLLFCISIAYIDECKKDRFIPYIVMLDKSGAILQTQIIQKDLKIPPQAITDFLCTYIESMYTSTSDREQNISLIKKVYASTNLKSDAKGKIDRYYQDKSAQKNIQDVAVETVSAISQSRYQLDFSVIQKDKSQRYKAFLSFEIKKVNAKDLETLRLNPLGIFINDIRVSKIISKV